MIIIRENNGYINQLDSMYPSQLEKITGENVKVSVLPHSTIYGVVFSGKIHINEKYVLEKDEYFSFATKDIKSLIINGSASIITRVGFTGQNVVGGPIEESGRLSYIDNCSDTLLVYPPRYGDPSISLLSFPPNITQRFHTHPSIRMGVIIRGEGYAETANEKIDLVPGVCFCVKEREIHRFVTQNSGLDAVSFHPDGDWGPTDHNHTLLNRTYTGAFIMNQNLGQ